MALNPYFQQGTQGEQRLVQDLINEHLKLYGVEVTYIPRKFVNKATIIEEVNTLSRIRDFERSKNSLIYLEDEASKTKQKELSAPISKLMEGELRIQMLSNIDEHYLIRPIDEPYVPENKFSPNRRIIVIVSTLFGGLLGCLIAIIIHFYRKKSS